MRRLLPLLLLAAGCAHVQGRALDVAPSLTVESPMADSVLHAAEAEVRGTIHTRDGLGWVWVDGTQAEVKDGDFVARRVPLREGKVDLGVVLTDSTGRKARMSVPVAVETHDRPFSSSLCSNGACLRYETRGAPRRDADGRITNAVVVVSAFGFGEKLDALWPELVGPGRALDSRKSFVIGVGARLDDDVDLVPLVGMLFEELPLARSTPLVGASTYGAETVLRLVARAPALTGPVVICGGHDRPYDEPIVRDAARLLEGTSVTKSLVELVVKASYTPAYLADVRHASEHGLVEEAKKRGLLGALVDAQLADAPSLDALRRRQRFVASLQRDPLVFSDLRGRVVTLVANARDGMSSLANVRALEGRMRGAGATVKLSVFDDELGHGAYFRHAVPALEQALVEATR